MRRKRPTDYTFIRCRGCGRITGMDERVGERMIRTHNEHWDSAGECLHCASRKLAECVRASMEYKQREQEWGTYAP